MKYGFPLGHSMIFLAWSLIDYKDAYVSAGEYENGLASIRWGADWILKVFLLLIRNTKWNV
jgi:endoglucanase